jgi:threonine/homoserine/homoserine lactone efflux protein
MTIEAYLAYLATVLVFFAHPPGPSQLLFMANSLRYGVRRSTSTMAGDLFANSLQIVIAGFGLVGVIAASANVFVAIKWLGVAYLVWIGLRSMLSAGKGRSTKSSASPALLFRQGFLTSAANPYAVVFFAALFPQFIDPSAPLAGQIAILGATYLVIDGAILLLFGMAVKRVFSVLGSKFERWVDRVSGTLMIVAAVLLSTRDFGAQPVERTR